MSESARPEALPRIAGRTLAVLRMLRDAGGEGLRPADFFAVGCASYATHVDELLKLGYGIEQVPLAGGASFLYRLTDEPDEPGEGAP